MSDDIDLLDDFSLLDLTDHFDPFSDELVETTENVSARSVRLNLKREMLRITQKENLRDAMRLLETHIVLDGDVLAVWCKTGRLQIIEADRIRDPLTPFDAQRWYNGVLVSPYGANTHYCIYKRLNEGGFEQERIIKADNGWLLGDFMRNDQIRGISPLAPAVNLFSQLHDSLDYALAKAKLSQLMGLVTKRTGVAPVGIESRDDTGRDEDDFHQQVKESFGNGVAHLDMDIDDIVEMFESRNPSSEFQNFCEQVIRLAFSALDIPYSFLDGSKTNYYGSEGEFEQYIDDCRKRQEQKLEFLQELTVRILEIAMRAGELDDAIRMGYTAETLADMCVWSGASIPIWRMLKYIKEYNLAVTNGLLNPFDICEMHDLDFVDNIKKMRLAKKIARGQSEEDRLNLTWDIDEPIKTNVGL